MVAGSSRNREKQEFQAKENVIEISGKPGFSLDGGLMHSVLDGDKGLKECGKLISESLNQGFSVIPEDIFEDIVQNYALAEHIYGPKLIRLLSGYENSFIRKNINVPEFQRELKERIEKKLEELKRMGLVEGNLINEKGLELASVIIYIQEMEKLVPRGFSGEAEQKREQASNGVVHDFKDYRKERYRDIAIKRSIKRVIRRGHKEIDKKDLVAFKREAKGQCMIIYALDASGSMKGEKIENCKRAGVALAYDAINKRDNVGLIVFGNVIKNEIKPTDDFVKLVKGITSIRASNETNIAITIRKAIEMFPTGNFTKHLILISDALPTIGENPEQQTLEAASIARNNRITISVVGIKLDRKGKELAKQIADIGEGRMYTVSNLENIDKIVLEDYHEL